MRRADAPRARSAGDALVLDGAVSFVPDLPGAQLLVAVAVTEADEPVAAAIAADADGVSTESLWRYDASRPLGHVTLSGARGTWLDVSAETLEGAWYLAHALIAAESIGAVQTCLDVSVATWEHDAPLFFRRAQLSRRLLGGTGDATDRVASATLRTAAAS